jgi:ribosomal protein L5
MDQKLTLKLDSTAIELAKTYAEKRQLSLSKIVESYFLQLAEKGGENEKQVSARIKKLSGIAPIKVRTRAEKSYTDYLLNKYYKK